MKRKMFWNGLLAGSMILMMSAAAFAAETEMPAEAEDQQVVYLDEAGEVTDEAGAAFIETTALSEDGQVVAVSYSDMDEKLAVLPAKGYACVMYEYNENGDVTAERYFGADGNRITLENGVSGFKSSGGKFPADLVWLDENDEPVMNTEAGYAHVTRGTDEKGNVVLVSFFDADDNLVVTPSGYAIVARAYDEEGRKTQEAYFGADEEPIALPGKDLAGFVTVYNEDGSKVTTNYAPDGSEITE